MAPAKILIVDDDFDILAQIVNIFETYEPDYTIFQATGGNMALNIIEKKHPDLIITDWEMPDIDGIEIIKKVNRSDYADIMPVIICTGVMTSSENLRTALRAGASDYIRKPIDSIELLARTRSMLMLSSSHKQIREQHQEIQIHRNFLQTIIHTIPQPLFYFNEDGILLGANSNFYSLLKIDPQKIKNQSVYKVFDAKNSAYHFKKDHELLKTGQLIEYECQFQDEGRNIFDYVFTKAKYYGDHSTSGIVCVMTDITQLKIAHKESIDSKKRELASTALKLSQLAELNSKIIQDLNKITRYTNKKGEELIKNIINEFQFTDVNDVWKEFEHHFEQVHETFYENLTEKFPGLTANEKKLCALLRLNLSSKEIASITFQNAQSVDMARYRLRKKLDIEKEVNLNVFLAEI
jgi:CheY-like chemotaxis protein/DNA-binding CsgD family transcriptional regulator